MPGDCSRLKYFNFTWTEFAGAKVMISRTGYTGELGYELFLPATAALALWEALAADPRVLPAGLGARDTIRLEMGYPLYGQDLDEEHTPAEAGYGWLLTSPAEYVGKGKAARLDAKLLALEIPGRRSARHGDTVTDKTGATVGVVTSASFAPRLGHAIALAYVKAGAAEAKEFRIKAARAELPAFGVPCRFIKTARPAKSWLAEGRRNASGGPERLCLYGTSPPGGSSPGPLVKGSTILQRAFPGEGGPEGTSSPPGRRRHHPTPMSHPDAF